MIRTLVAAAALVTGVACLDLIDPLDPQVGDPLAPRCANEDSDPDTDVSFAQDILPLLQGQTGAPGCSCHLSTTPDPIGIQQTGLDLTTYDRLREGGTNSLTSIVIPGAPCDSVLWQKVSPGPPFGSRMPFNGPPFLDETARQLIADWIAEGARDN